MPHLSNSRGSFLLKRKFRGVPKIRRATGTDNLAVYEKILTMCEALHAQGRFDLLAAIARGRLTPLEVYAQWRVGAEVELPTADVAPLLSAAWEEWAAKVPGDDHRRSIRGTGKALKFGDASTLADLPDLLASYKDKNPDKVRSVNLARAHVRAFLRDKVGTGHRLYTAVKDLRPIAKPKGAKKAEKGTPHTVEVIRAVCAKLAKISGDPRVGLMGWTMAATSMGNKEYWRDGFEQLPALVKVNGQKRGGREREVPRWTLIGGPVVNEKKFRAYLKAASDGKVAIYDLRRSFARWAEEAGIIQTNIDAYMGHGPKSMTALYTFGQLPGQLEGDAAKLTAYAGGEAPMSLMAKVS